MTTELHPIAIAAALEQETPARATDSESLGENPEIANRLSRTEKRGAVLEAQVERRLESASTAAVQLKMLKVFRNMQRRRQDSDNDNEL